MPELLTAPVRVVLAAVLGLIFGSFVTALTYRLPRGESIARGRSRCPACGHTLSVQDLVPVFSWLISRGGCRYCRAAVSPRYPIIEALSLTLFVTTALTLSDPRQCVIALLSVPLLLALAVIDFEFQRVPDVLVAVLLPLALAWRWLGDGAVGAGVLAALVTLAVAVAIGAMFRDVTGASGLGLGDAKLIALAAIAFPLFAFFIFLAAASATGIALALWWRSHTGRTLFPFAVTITLAWWCCLILPIPARP